MVPGTFFLPRHRFVLHSFSLCLACGILKSAMNDIGSSEMGNDIFLQALRFWLKHPWRVFWCAIAGFYGVGLLFVSVFGEPSYQVEVFCQVLFILVLALSFIQGLRTSWKTSPFKAVGILTILGSLPLLNHVPGPTVQGIVVALVVILVPASLAAGAEYVARRVERGQNLPPSIDNQ